MVTSPSVNTISTAEHLKRAKRNTAKSEQHGADEGVVIVFVLHCDQSNGANQQNLTPLVFCD